MSATKYRILIADDEPGVRFVLERTLAHEGYECASVQNGLEAIERIQHNEFDLVLLDLQMEPVGGMQVLENLRKRWPETVVIILTAHGTLNSAVNAIRLTAFDYLFKPASAEVIRQRVREGLEQRATLVRRARLVSQIETLQQALDEIVGDEKARSPAAEPDRFLHAGGLIIDQYHHLATFEEKQLDLTSSEYNLLVCLVNAAPKAVSSRHLLNAALGYDAEEAEAAELIKWHIHKLRQKIEPNPQQPRYLKTVRYQGYAWVG
jgi:DNA-binding response OmpR family regulator